MFFVCTGSARLTKNEYGVYQTTFGQCKQKLAKLLLDGLGAVQTKV
jgi:hypothetical protein